MTLRYIIYALVAVLCAYLCWLVLGYFAVARRRRRSLNQRSDEPDFDPLTHMMTRGLEPGSINSVRSAPTERVPSQMPSMRVDASERRLRAPEPPDASRFGFEAMLEMRQTRHLVDDLQRQLADLSKQLADVQNQVLELRSTASVSPYYSEAAALARRGYDAQAIAERCGISVAEADMIRSLSSGETPAET